MTIKSLTTFLKKKNINSSIVPLSNLKGYIMGIDGHNYIHKLFSVAHSRSLNSIDISSGDRPSDYDILTELLNKVFADMDTLWSNGVKPVFIFDGSFPEEKKETINKRIEQGKKRKDEENKLKEELKNSDPLLRSMDKVNKLKKIMSQDSHINDHIISSIKEFISDIGLPVIQLDEEGEKVGSLMCKDKYIDILYTTDSDALAYKCPLIAKSMKLGSKPEIELITYKYVKDSLNLSSKQFIEFCIMCGCDYNSNIPGIGPAKSYKLICDKKKLHNIKKDYDIECLKYKKCKEIFTSKVDLSNIKIEWNIPKNISHTMERYQIKRGYSSYTHNMKIMRDINGKMDINDIFRYDDSSDGIEFID
jgi:flap endonuclease-1